MTRLLRVVLALVLAGAGVAAISRWRSGGDEPRFMRMEPTQVTSPERAPEVFWGALTADNSQQVRLVATIECLSELGGDAGLARVASALNPVNDERGLSGTDPYVAIGAKVDPDSLLMDRSINDANRTGEFVASFDLVRTNYEALLTSLREANLEELEDPNGFDVVLTRLERQQFVLIDGGWRLDGDCGLLESQVRQ